MKKLYTIILATLLLCGFNLKAQWSPVGNGTNQSVYALAADTTNSILYAGGKFTQADGNNAFGIAQWDGITWSALGSGLGGGNNISAIIVRPNGNVVAGGDFTTIGAIGANNVAEWDGTQWNPLGAGVSSPGVSIIEALELHNNELYAGGLFLNAGGVLANNIAKWDGTQWVALGSGTNGRVESLHSYNGVLYVGGQFDSAGGVSVSNLAAWDGTNWSDVAGGVSGLDARVSALSDYQGDLIVGGTFDNAGGVLTANNIVRFDFTNWLPIGVGGFDYNGVTNVGTITPFGTGIVAGGAFTLSDGSPANFIAQWDGLSWLQMNQGMDSTVHASVVLDEVLYAGGDFENADNSTANRVAQWDQVISVEEIPFSDISIYPNPSIGKICVSHKRKDLELEQIKIYSLEGKLVFTSNFNGQSCVEIDINNNGQYLFTIENMQGKVLYSSKIFIVR